MAAVTLGQLWKNEYFRTAMMIILTVVIVFGFWFVLQSGLNTSYPALAVASRSMLPTLNVGDLIIVQGVSPVQINAQHMTGDVIVFRSPNNPEELIVHRAVYKELRNNVYWFTTHGDNNPPGVEEKFDESYLIGRVVARIPYMGNFALLIHSQGNMYFIIILVIIILIALFTMLPFDAHSEEKPVEESHKKRKLFGKIDLEMVYVMIINLLLISLIIFNLWGAFTFWQPGAKGPQYVTIRGMYPDLQYQENFRESSNIVSEAFLSHGFLTYKIDCLVNENIRAGVPTVSWAQFSILILLLFDVWTLIKYVKQRKMLETRAETQKAI